MVVAEGLEWVLTGAIHEEVRRLARAGWGAMIGGMIGAFMGVPVPIVGSIIGAFVGAFIGAFVVRVQPARDTARRREWRGARSSAESRPRRSKSRSGWRWRCG